MLRLRKYTALLSLLAFLFPQALNLAHELEHRSDFHCSEKSITHFHNEEHHCDICDFIPLVSGDVRVKNYGFSDHYYSYLDYTAALIEHTSASSSYYILLRGPPAV